MSGNKDTACASCHHPNLAGGDALPLSIGVNAETPNLLGPGRLHQVNSPHYDAGPTVPRNSPSTFNIAFYTQTLFHDGRIQRIDDNNITTPDVSFNQPDPLVNKSLVAAQAKFPITSEDEMLGFNFQYQKENNEKRQGLINRLIEHDNNNQNQWLELFKIAFNQRDIAIESLITVDNITFAISEYEKSQILINNPWSKFLSGDDTAISEQAKKGALLFYLPQSKGGFSCSDCHSGPFFTDEKFHILAIPQIGRGKNNGPFLDHDFGRFNQTQLESDRYAFRTPTLLNITKTGPWGHNGAFIQLEDIIKHHLNIPKSLQEYIPDNIQPGIQIDNWYQNTSAIIDHMANFSIFNNTYDYNNKQIEALSAFLSTLTDPCISNRQCMAKWIPSDNDPNPDGLRLIAIDNLGNPLQ